MTIVAMWCRHDGDDIIGANGGIPWNVPSDSRHFYDVVAGQTVVMGRKTYESLPGQTIAGCPIWVLTANRAYELTDAAMHRIKNAPAEISKSSRLKYADRKTALSGEAIIDDGLNYYTEQNQGDKRFMLMSDVQDIIADCTDAEYCEFRPDEYESIEEVN